MQQTNDQEEEYDENVAALKKLSKTKSPAAQVVQDLLKVTREMWLSTVPVLIHEIIGVYPVLELPKWVRACTCFNVEVFSIHALFKKMQLLHEFNNLEGKDMLETMNTNWKRVCDKLQSDRDESSSWIYAEEKKVLQIIEKNVYHRKTASPVIIAEV